MTSKTFIAILSLFIISSTAFGQSLSLESVDGLSPTGNLALETEITFNIRLTNNAIRNSGITNGFSIASPDGANWGTLVGDTLTGMKAAFDLIFQINTFSTGNGADTVGFGGAALFGAGLVASFDEIAYSITIGPFVTSEEGKHIVLDSAFYQPSGTWKWAGPEEFPSWDGPHEFLIGDAEPRNAAPVLDYIGDRSISEGENLNFLVSASDSNGDALTLTAATLPPEAEFIDYGDGTGEFNWTPDFEQAAGFFQAGIFDITFMVSDGDLTHDELVTISVDNTNRAPVLESIGPQSVNENETLSFIVSASDLDLEQLYLYMSLTFSIDSSFNQPTFIDYGDGTGLFTWIPDFEQAGTYDILFRVGDGHPIMQGGLIDEEIVTITVNNVNRPPVLASIGNKSVDEGQPLVFRTHATDPDYFYDFIMPQLSIDPLPPGANYELYGDGTGDFIFGWQPDFTQAGTYVVTFQASDGELVDQEAVTITVNNIIQPPLLSVVPNSLHHLINQSDSILILDFLVQNISADQIPTDFEITESISWLSFNKSTGTTPETMAYVITNPGGVGTVYSDSIMITSPTATNSPYYVPVILEVVEADKVLIASQRTVKFIAVAGHDAPLPQKIAFSELNGSLLDFELKDFPDWIVLDKSVGQTPDSIEISINPASLTSGSRYFENIYFYYDGYEGNEDGSRDHLIIQLDYMENLPPQINLEDSIFYTYLSETLEIVGSVSDFENDAFNLWVEPALENLTITIHENEFVLLFNPNENQTGTINLSIHLSDGIATTTASVILQVTPRGDFNLDRTVDISDLMAMVEFFFLEGEAPQNMDYADLTNDGVVDISDLIKLVKYIF